MCVFNPYLLEIPKYGRNILCLEFASKYWGLGWKGGDVDETKLAVCWLFLASVLGIRGITIL